MSMIQSGISATRFSAAQRHVAQPVKFSGAGDERKAANDIGQVVDTFVELALAQQEFENTKKAFESAQRTLDIANRKFDSALNKVELEFPNVKAMMEDAMQQVDDRLAVLRGKFSQRFVTEVKARIFNQSDSRGIAKGGNLFDDV